MEWKLILLGVLIIIINDIINNLEEGGGNGKVVAYADYVVILASGKFLVTSLELAERSLRPLCVWGTLRSKEKNF